MPNRQTHEARPQTAARLREMAEASKRSAETSRYHEKHCRADMFLASAESHRVDAENYEANVVALLAGAEALEAVPLAQEQAATVWGLACERDELRAARDKRLEAVRGAKVLLKTIALGASWSPTWDAEEALARLEAL